MSLGMVDISYCNISKLNNIVRACQSTKLVQIFNAIKHISTAGLLYGSVTLKAVRICGRSRRILLYSHPN